MMNFYRAGGILYLLPATYRLLCGLFSGRVFFRVLPIAGCICLMLFGLPDARSQSPERQEAVAGGKEEIKPLQIGDTIPEELWSMPLQVVNHPEGKETITLSEYKDKLIILDFWATWCTPCIKSLQKLDSIQEEFKDKVTIIPTTYESVRKVKTFFESRELSLPSVISHSDILKAYFPHNFIPHQIWVLNNKVRAIPKSEDVEAENIEKVLIDDRFTLHTKRDLLDYDASTNVLIFAEKTQAPVLSTSSFTAHIDGAPASMGVTRKEDEIIVNYTNVNPLLMYSKALGARNNRIVVDGYNLNKIENQKNDNKNRFCYQLILPDTVQGRTIKRRVLADIGSQFDLHLDSQIMDMNCYVISRVSNSNNPKSGYKTIDSTGHGESLSLKFSDFVDLLNFSVRWTPDQPIFIDESEFSGNIRTESYKILQKDIERLKANLRPYGLTVTNGKRPVKMYILSDAVGITPEVD